MSCEHCVRSVQEALESLEGIASVSVSLEDGAALVEGQVSDDAIRAVLEEEEYVVPAIVRS
jgi:copper chaperone CopZ|tara:strand:+ start:752 stop:934 length:183 start_codon:yes stop_codon:yes gene_type:complete